MFWKPLVRTSRLIAIAITTTIALAGAVGPLHGGDAGLSAARGFLEDHRLVADESTPPADFAERSAKIAASRDPGSQLGRLLFALARPGTKVLDADQLKAAAEIIAVRQASEVNWHDVRNIIRVQAMRRLFPHAIASDAEELATIRAEWESWTDLRLAYMFQEFVAQERFQRAFWEVLTPEQRRAASSGELDAKFQKSTGHSRDFFADRIVTRALGKPDHAEAFDEAVARWRIQWPQATAELGATAALNRKREFAMDDADEAFAIATWPAQAAAFRTFATAERDAIRDLVQAGYERDSEIEDRITALVATQRAEMKTKYQPHGTDLLRRLGEIE